MACESWRAKLDMYLDNELLSEEARSFDAHVRSCPACALEALSRVQTKRRVQAAGKRFAPSAEFRSRMKKSVAARPQRSFGLAWRWAPATLALVLVAGGLVGGEYWGEERGRTDQIFAEVADLHVANLAGSSPVDVVSTDRHTVKPWFQGRIPFSFDLPELQNSEFSLVGGRMTYLEQAPGAHLIYQVRKHEISVFIFQAGALPGHMGDSDSVTKILSFNATRWSRGGLRYFVIGDASARDIEGLAHLLKTTAS